jgi:hypothetical protein
MGVGLVTRSTLIKSPAESELSGEAKAAFHVLMSSKNRPYRVEQAKFASDSCSDSGAATAIHVPMYVHPSYLSAFRWCLTRARR